MTTEHPGAKSRQAEATAVTAYTAVLLVVAKFARAVELCERADTWAPLWQFPLMLGQDVVLLACVALLAHALSRVALPWIRLTLLGLLVLPLPLLLPADVVSHKLTGAPLTWQRLRGDEGATLADLDLLASADLWGGLSAIVLGLAALWPALRFAPRLRLFARLARPRSLFVALIAGVGLSMLQRAAIADGHGLADQPLLVMLDSFGDRVELGSYGLSPREWRELHRPAVELPDLPAPKVSGPPPKNVVMFLAEGIAFKHTGFGHQWHDPASLKRRKKRGEPLSPTPYLVERQRKHGFLFDYYHANWHASIQAIFSIVCSAFPPMRGDIVRIKPRIDCGEMSEVMRDNGIASGLFHGGQFNFYNKLALLGHRGYSIELDAEELAKQSKRRLNQWGIDDRAMVEATLEWVDSLPKGQRFAALLIPITAHYPYWLPSDFRARFRSKTREGRFLSAVQFQDFVFEQLLQGFETRGLYEDTLFVWLGDHGHYVAEPLRRTPGLRLFYEPNLHTALVLINQRMFPPSLPAEERVSHRLGGHPDLLPTILDALGIAQDPRHQGQSLLAPSFENRRVFFGADNGKYIGFLEGRHKFALDVPQRRSEYYDLEADPEELSDVSAKFPERMTQYSQDVIRFARAVRAGIDAAPVLPEKVSVTQLAELFMKHVQVTLHDGQRATPCSKEDHGCPGLPDVLRIHQGRVEGEARRCVMVKVPAKGNIELEVRDPTTLELISGTIVSVNKPRTRDARFRVLSYVDGRAHRGVTARPLASARPRHPRATRSLRYVMSRDAPASPKQPPDAGTDPAELCLQLSTLVQ